MKNRYPKGWDEKRISMVISHYEDQNEEEATTEDEDVFKDITQTAMEVPIQLVPKVRELIAKHQALKQGETIAANVWYSSSLTRAANSWDICGLIATFIISHGHIQARGLAPERVLSVTVENEDWLEEWPWRHMRKKRQKWKHTHPEKDY